ncbi:MAG TPA: hypothetical protein VGF56_01005 [Rhizomicrobium sp.]|jgi:hypothetical protein
MVEQDTPIGTPYGTQTRLPRRRIAWLLWMFALVALVYWTAAAFCILVDPFDIYPWGLQVHLKHANYPSDSNPYLIDVAAKDPTIDTMLVGSSTAVDFTREQMMQIPGTKNPFNLSYEGALPADREVVTTQMLKYSHASRVILSFDFTYALDKDEARDEFPFYLYDGDAVDDLRMVGSTSARSAFSALTHHGEISNGGGNITNLKHEEQFQDFQTPASMRALAKAVVRYRGEVDRPTAKTCAAFTAIDAQLVPYARALSRRHVALDVYIPPYATVTFYDWQNGLRRGLLGDSIMEDQFLTRSCLVEALDGLPGVRIFAFDNEAWITDDLANYKDTAHVYNDRIQTYIMKQIGAGTHQLTKANVDGYLDTLHRRILAAQVVNSKVKF